MTSSEIFPRLLPTDASGSATACDYRDGSAWRISWENGLIRELTPAPNIDAPRHWIAPALVDVQVNGYGGIDFQRVADADSLRQAVLALRRDGCARFLLTLITAPWETLLARIASLRTIIRRDPELAAAIVGWHIEGPFLSAEPGYCGAHNREWMRDLTPRHVHELKAVVHSDPLLLTVAPERASDAAITEAARAGFIISFGHTNAPAERLRLATNAGGSAFTHLANGCPQALDRHDNIILRVAEESRLTVGLIPDGIHVSPALFSLLHRALGTFRIYWTTDAMAAAGAPEGHYTLGSLGLDVGPDRVVRNPATGTFAGSALSPIDGIRLGARMLGIPWQKAWDFFSRSPARLMNLPCTLAPGQPFCLLQEG